MNVLKVIGILFVVAFLFSYGCLESPTQKTVEKTTEKIEQKQTEQEQTEQKQENNEGNLGEMTIEQMLMQGTPIECNTYMEMNGKKINTNLKMLGGKYKVEAEVEGIKVITIYDGKKVYMRTEGPYMQSDCDWYSLPEDQEVQGNGGFTIEDFEGDSDLNYDCHAAAFTSDIFEPTGKVCDINSMYQ